MVVHACYTYKVIKKKKSSPTMMRQTDDANSFARDLTNSVDNSMRERNRQSVDWSSAIRCPSMFPGRAGRGTMKMQRIQCESRRSCGYVSRTWMCLKMDGTKT